MIGLGFSPLAASGLCLIANTAPVAYGALGTPVIALAAVTGIDLMQLSGMIGRQLPLFSLLVPFWLIWAFAGFRGMLQIWPAILVAGLSFAIPQYLVSNFHGPWLVDVVAAIVSMVSLILFLKVWKPKKSGRRLHSKVMKPIPANLIWKVKNRMVMKPMPRQRFSKSTIPVHWCWHGCRG
jgi:lactate permease